MLTMVFEVLHEGEALIDENDEVLTVPDTTPATIQALWEAVKRDCGMGEYYDDWQEFAIDLSFNPIFIDAIAE